jgi:hypothetical protein
MTKGTKSILFGYHQFLLHPLLVAAGWTIHYGFPLDPRLWIAFFVHDLGYLGKKNMDDEEGETHPILGAKIMSIFGSDWHDLVLYHSRYYSKRFQKPTSKLCVADKHAYLLYPNILIWSLNKLSGEGKEYAAMDSRRAGLKQTEWQVIKYYKIQTKEWLKDHA